MKKYVIDICGMALWKQTNFHFFTIRTEIFFSIDKNLSLCHRDVSIFQVHSISWQAFEFMLASLRFAQWIFIIQEDWVIISFLRMAVTPWTPNKPNSSLFLRFWWRLFLFHVRVLMIFTVCASHRIRLQNGEKFNGNWRRIPQNRIDFYLICKTTNFYKRDIVPYGSVEKKKTTIDLKSIWFVCRSSIGRRSLWLVIYDRKYLKKLSGNVWM